MDQKSLFETTQRKTIYDVADVPVARNSDPETSAEAADSIDRDGLWLSLFRGFEFHGNKGATVKEAAIAGKERWQDIESVRKRYVDLVAAGVIEKHGKRKCSCTGKTVTVYRLRRCETDRT